MAQAVPSSISAAEEQRYAELQVMALDFAREGETAELSKMLVAGLPVNLADHRGNTLLMLAAYNDNVETLKMLIAAGADVDRCNSRGQTPLGGVAFKGYCEVARVLIAAGADVNADNGNGATPYDYARMFGRVEMAELLSGQGARRGKVALSYTMIGYVLSRIMRAWNWLLGKLK